MTLLLDQKLDTGLIREWVAEAGDIAQHYFGRVVPDWKGVADPVTAADREIEQLLARHIRAAYPEHGILGEEYGGEALDHDTIWAIDPIDGTRVYVEGLPTWSITLGVLHQGTPVFGLVYMPLYDDWTYTDGDDVLCNGASIQGQLMDAWDADSFLMGRSDAVSTFDIPFTRVMALGSTATHLAYTARGAAVATVTHDSYLWDIAGGAAILHKLGGDICDLDGQPLDFSQMDLTQPISGFHIAGHPDVTRRLATLVKPRRAPINHPAW
jgi:myo-inositol-1(or 4)-monophosphatase